LSKNTLWKDNLFLLFNVLCDLRLQTAHKEGKHESVKMTLAHERSISCKTHILGALAMIISTCIPLQSHIFNSEKRLEDIILPIISTVGNLMELDYDQQ
jgi:hypothetical protein